MGRDNKHIKLNVVMNGDWVGTLTRTPSGTLEFQYSQDWLDYDATQAISLSMPLREEVYRDHRVNAYFDNLLPENDQIRRRIAEKFNAEGRTAFDLLASIGRDCVGALQFVPDGEEVIFTPEAAGEPLTDGEVAESLRNLKTYPLGLGRDREFRISLAGAQEKTALLKLNDTWCKPLGTTATTHIFKPPIGELPNAIDMSSSVENEWLCLKLTKYFGLPSAAATIAVFETTKCLVVERFDRRWTIDGKSLFRVPQEDLCQALAVPWSRKYENEGGPGTQTIMQFLNASDLRDKDREQFLRAQLVFFLMGAIDGHAKNFSIALSPTGFRLTPIYDVLTVLPALQKRQIEIKEVKMAMSVGEKHYHMREITRLHWEQTAKKCGFPSEELTALIDELLGLVQSLPEYIDQFREEAGTDLTNALVAGIKKNAEALKA